METLSIDLETYSSVDLKKSGVYPYVESEDFDILLFGYSVDEGPVEVIDLASGEKLPESILEALAAPSIRKWAYNASFERICLSAWLRRNYPKYFEGYGEIDDTTGNYLDPSSWYCSRVWGAYMGLPMSLKGIGAVLKLEEQKMGEGSDLIKYFCRPCRPTKSNGGRLRNLPSDAPEKWEMFKAYNRRDVEVELAIKRKLVKFPVPDFVWDEYHLDQQINDRGILIDTRLVQNAIMINERTKDSLRSRMQVITGLENPNSVSQMKTWLAGNGVNADSLDKKAVKEMLSDVDESIAGALECRQQLAKSSISKYAAMQKMVCEDNRARGCFMFYGTHTGRFASKGIQFQNLSKNHMQDLAEARQLVKDGNHEALELLYDNIPQVLSELIRTAFIPKRGYKYIVADFSAIEARVLSFLAGEQWRNDLFASGGDIYCRSASQMFGVPVEKNGVNGHLRQKGKIAELACIAEGELVLTDQGLVPIQNVTTDMRVWDGENWVHHDGVVFRGEKEVITYRGLTATLDHYVYVLEQKTPIMLITAAANNYSLICSGPENNVPDDQHFRMLPTFDIMNAGPNHRFTVSGHLVHNCGYGGSVGALKAMGALEMGLQESELQPLVDAWRAANPNITRFWWDVDAAVKEAVINKSETETHGFRFRCESGMLFIDLPSGRSLAYVKPKIGINKYGSESVTYEGMNMGKWDRLESYGPKFVENIVQAVSRDVLCFAMKTLSCHRIVAHVHDELIIECPMRESVESICRIMGMTPCWIDGLLLRADGYECEFYRKD